MSELRDAALNLLDFIWEDNFAQHTESEYERAVVRLNNAAQMEVRCGGCRHDWYKGSCRKCGIPYGFKEPVIFLEKSKEK